MGASKWTLGRCLGYTLEEGNETLAPLLPLLFPSPQEVHHFL